MAKITKLQTELKPMPNLSKAVPVKNPRSVYNLYTSDFSNLTADSIKFYLESARLGINFWKSLLFEEMRRRDSHIGAVCQTRKLSVSAIDYKIECEDEKMKEFIKLTFDGFNFTNFITDIVEASIQGCSLFEINYANNSLGTVPTEINLIPNHLVMYNDDTSEYMIMDSTKADNFLLRSISSNSLQDSIDVSQVPRIDVDPLKLLTVYSFDGNSQNGLQNGCIDSLIWAYFFKNYGIKDWSTYLERYAIPWRAAKYDPMMGSQDKNSLIEAVKNAGNNSYLVYPNTAEINFISDQGKGNSSDLFSKFIEYWNEQCSIRVLGQTLTTKMEGSGSYAAAKVHDNVRKDIMSSDMKLVEITVNELIRRVMDLNYSSVVDYPKFEFTEAENLDYMKIKSEIYKNINDLGVKISPDQLSEDFGIEVNEAPKQKFSEDSENKADDEIDLLIKEIWKENTN